jgi:NAD+ synthase
MPGKISSLAGIATERLNMSPKQQINHITRWIKSYAKQHRVQTLVVGVSGGIDSAVVSALCARTGVPTIAVSMPIHQSKKTHSLSVAQGQWLVENFTNVRHRMVDLTPTFRQFERIWDGASELGLANSRSRMRMMCLYQIAQDEGGIVVGTGNKVEDFGVGFYTKYGDGGVDISPIGDCMKTEVWAMGRELGILQDIVTAAPTDGLWADGRTDESQLGMTYPELEVMMHLDTLMDDNIERMSMSREQRAKLKRYQEIRARNLHKMTPIPVCMMPVDQ